MNSFCKRLYKKSADSPKSPQSTKPKIFSFQLNYTIFGYFVQLLLERYNNARNDKYNAS